MPEKRTAAESPPMVEVRGLKKYFAVRRKGLFQKPGQIRAVDGVGFSILRGQCLGLVGESGSGKTTVARSILRLIEPDEGCISIDGTLISDLDRGGLRRFRSNMQIVFQDPFGSLNPRMTIGKVLAEPLKIHSSLSKNQIQEKITDILELVGLSGEQADRYPHEFSGGQRQRIGIARAIALNPGFIILDEPVSALDVSIQAQILNLLTDLRDRLNLTYLFVAHDLSVVEHISDTIAVMYLGRIIEESPRENLYRNPLHPYTQSLIKSIPEKKPLKHGFNVLRGEIPSPENPPGGCYFHPRCQNVMDICREKYPEMRPFEGGRVACHLY